MIQALWIPGPLPGLNELFGSKALRGKAAHGHKVWNQYNETKRHHQERIIYLARAQLKPVKSAKFSYVFTELHQRRDPSNFIGAGIKIIEDALQIAGVIPGDGWSVVKGIQVEWLVDDREPGVLVRMESEDGEARQGKNGYVRVPEAAREASGAGA